MRSRRLLALCAVLIASPYIFANGNTLPQSFGGDTPVRWSARMARSEMGRLGDTLAWRERGGKKWDYAAALFAWSLLELNSRAPDPAYLPFVERSIGSYILPDGQIQTYKADDTNLDNINGGRTLLALHRQTGDARYHKAAVLLREQLDIQPRTSDGGFWHKKRYPNQMWLDGLYMAQPFYAAYAKSALQTAVFDDIAKQILLADKHLYDPATGLFSHGWDESKQQDWADKSSGRSQCCWARGIGWYGMALVDTLDSFPPSHPARRDILSVLRKLCAGIAKYQDRDSGLWFQVIDQSRRKGNYPEASASAMFVYIIAKGINRGYLPGDLAPVAANGYAGLIRRLVRKEADGSISLTHCCSVAGLGPGRDGSYEYYLREPVVDNDLKGVGPFILAGLEMQTLACRQTRKR